MASSKVMPSSTSRNSDLSRAMSSSSSLPKSKPQSREQEQLYHNHKLFSDRSNRRDESRIGRLNSPMTLDRMLRDVYSSSPPTESTLLDASFTLIEAPSSAPAPPLDVFQSRSQNGGGTSGKTAEEVWREIVAGDRKEMKEETLDEMMTLEDFLMKAGAAVETDADVDVKVAPDGLSGGVYSLDPVPSGGFHMMDKVEGSIVGFGNGAEVYGGVGRVKRGRVAMEPLDKAAQQRQRRMIKNRESAARSRERKQAYQKELEATVMRLEDENAQLLKEKAERLKERHKQLMERVIPVAERQRPRQRRLLRRVHSLEW